LDKRLRDGTAVNEFGDGARVGQKNKITRRWARRGTLAEWDSPADTEAYAGL
jgi:hypothetical protein